VLLEVALVPLVAGLRALGLGKQLG